MKMKIELTEEEINHLLMLLQRDMDVFTAGKTWSASMALHTKLVHVAKG